MFYIGYVMPNVDKSHNIIELINEEFVLVCAYLSMTLIGLSTSPEMSNEIGAMMKFALQMMLAFNLIFILSKILHSLKQLLKKWQQ